MNFTPPEPVTIQVPESVAPEHQNNDEGLLIRFLNEKDLYLTYIPKSQDRSGDSLDNLLLLQHRSILEAELKDASIEMIKDFIKEAIKTNGDKSTLNIKIIGDNKSNLQSFKNTIHALRDLKIYRFQLITTPE